MIAAARRGIVLLAALTGAGCAVRSDARAARSSDSAAAAAARGDYPAAVRWLDTVIALRPRSVTARRDRGVARGRIGDTVAALSDFDSALAMAPGDAATLGDRGFLRQFHGDCDRAMADFDSALRIDSTLASVRKNRGRCEFYLGRFDAAARDLGRELGTRSANAYTAIWYHLAVMRGGGDSLRSAASLAAADSAPWPGPVVRFYRGLISADSLTGAARHTGSGAGDDQRCAAAFYLGEAALWHHDSALAGRRFAETLAGCPSWYSEYQGALAESRRIKP